MVRESDLALLVHPVPPTAPEQHRELDTLVNALAETLATLDADRKRELGQLLASSII